MEEKIYFREVQYFRQPWIWILVGGIALLSWAIAAARFLVGRLNGDKPEFDYISFIVWIIFGILFPGFFIILRLEVEVKDSGLHHRFFPLVTKMRQINFEQIAGASSITYRPLGDYGGWGIRYGRGGKAYNVSGNRGVDIVLINGKKLMFGSLHPEEFVEALRKASGRPL
jgi:hypothetical protein